jgi:hypothetical protein
MSLFRRSINEGDKVRCHVKNDVKDYWTTGVVLKLCYNPYLPVWLSPPNYDVKLDTTDGSFDNEIFKRSQLRLIKRKDSR